MDFNVANPSWASTYRNLPNWPASLGAGGVNPLLHPSLWDSLASSRAAAAATAAAAAAAAAASAGNLN